MSKDNQLPLYYHLGTSCTASTLAELITLPADTLKVHLQTNPNTPGILNTSSKIYQQHGIGGFYQSWIPSIGRQLTSTGIQD